ncbi:MAG: hypothetical protein ACK4VO_09895 [Pseudobdellovibrio sp.]
MIQDSDDHANRTRPKSNNSSAQNTQMDDSHDQNANTTESVSAQDHEPVQDGSSRIKNDSSDTLNNEAINNETSHESTFEAEKIKIQFPYSEIARAAAPKVFDVAETVATQWVHDQKFENLGLPNPIAEFAAIKALEKAKEVEKKLEEKGVITAAKMGIEIAKLQAQSLLQKWKK